MCCWPATCRRATAWWTAYGRTNFHWWTRFLSACTPTTNWIKSTLTVKTCGTLLRCSPPPAHRSTCSRSSRPSSPTPRLTSDWLTLWVARNCTSLLSSITPTSWSTCSITTKWLTRWPRSSIKQTTRVVPSSTNYCRRIKTTWISITLLAMSWRR